VAVHKSTQLYRRARHRLARELSSLPLGNQSLIKHFTTQLRALPTDAYIISFPKCGRTWLRLMIGWSIAYHYGLVDDHSRPNSAILDLQRLAAKRYEVPRIVLEHDDDAFFKSPNELTCSKQEYRKAKVIFLVRDPRDVIISTYFHKLKRKNFMPTDPSRKAYAAYDGTISDFLREPIGSFETLLSYYNIWEKCRFQTKDFLLIYYEDLHLEPVQQLATILDFLDLSEISASTVEKAVEFASFDNMRKMEEANVFKSGILKPISKGDFETYKTRKGKVGGFAESLANDDIDYLNGKMRSTLSSYYRYVSHNNIPEDVKSL
jgi:hypothetical protein